MKKIIALFFAFITILSMSACRIEKVSDSNEPAQTYHLNLRNFTAISNNTNCDVHFTQSNTYSVTLKATKRWYETHDINVSNGVLTLSEKSQKKEKGITVLTLINKESGAELWVSGPTLSAAQMYGSGDFSFDNDFKGESLEIDIVGSGDTSLKGVSLTGDFEYNIAGSGDLKTGLVKAQNAKFSVAGSGDINAGLENVDNTKIGISGSGDVNANFNNCGYASVSISGSGDMTLKGQLKRLDKSVSGSGDIDVSKLQVSK